MAHDYDAVIVGAGPAGATAAILLAEAGWSVAVVEKTLFPRRKVCGECIAATNLPLLRSLGVADEFMALAGPELRRVGLFVGDTTLSADLPPLTGDNHAWGRALGREHLDTLLLGRAVTAGAEILQPSVVDELTTDGTAYRFRVVSTNTNKIKYLYSSTAILANGSWEADPCAKNAAPRPMRPSDLFAFKANFRHCDLRPGLLPVLAFPGGYGGMVLEDGGRATLACCIRRDTLQACRRRWPNRRAAEAVLAYLQNENRGVRQALSGAQREGAWLSVGPLRTGMRPPWRGGGLFAVGNAAGEAHPIVGEGISMAIQGAWLLAGQLTARWPQGVSEDVSAHDLAVVGHRYATVWRRSFAARIRMAAMLAHLAMRPRVATALLPVLKRWPGIMSFGAHLSGKVKKVVVPNSGARPLPS
jgi:2-polyprenyl-6-methoxyphenol hydroxylase-like FAD-dependent oxidoreductase